jgi:hypothetical protein
VRHFSARRCYLFAPITLAGLLLGIPPVLGTEAAETPSDIVYTTLSVRPDGSAVSDVAKLYARARVAYVSSGAIAFAVRMIDNDLRTAFRFPGGDLHPTVIVELAQTEQIHRVSTVYEAEGARLDVYLLNELPKHPGDLRALKPIASVLDPTNRGEAAVDFAPTGAHYVALQWTRQKSTSEKFRVTEISVLSVVSREQVLSPLAYGEMRLPGESGPDFSNKLGTLADPPKIGSVSP